MKLVDMKVTRKEQESAPPPKKVYPWGLEIRLDSEALSRLGITDLPEAGAECTIGGIGKVTEVVQSASEERQSRSISIQIMRLAISHDEDGEKAFERGFRKGPKRNR